MSENPTLLRRIRSAARREPLVPFVVVGAVLYGFWVIAAPADVETIRVEGEVLRAVEEQQEYLLGRPLTDDERALAREGYIDEEVLLREALGRGLHWSDSRVRQRLTGIVRAALTETVPDPSVAQLQAHFADNIEKYSTPESMTIEQIFFPWGDEIDEGTLGGILAEIRNGADVERFGTNSRDAPRSLPWQTRIDLVRLFGPNFANRVEELPAGQWHGPVESVQGVHLVRVVERHPPQVATFENVEPFLRQDWLMTRTRELQQERIDEVRDGYRIRIVEK
jgi:hypothetical protein